MPVVLIEAVLLPLQLLLLVLLLYMMRRSLNALMDAALHSLAGHGGVLGAIRRALTAPVAGALKVVDYVIHKFEAAVAEAAFSAEQRVTGFFFGLAHLIQYFAFTLYYLPMYAGQAFRTLRHVVIPALLVAATYPLRVGLAHVATAEHALGREAHRDYAALRKYAKWIGALAVAVATLPLHGIDRRIHTAEGVIGRTWRQIRAMRKRLTIAALAGIVLAVLSRAGYGWLRCSNVNKVGKSLCRMPVRLLDDLLAGVLPILIVSDLCELVSLMSGTARLLEPELAAFVGGIDALIGCRGATAPGPLAYNGVALAPAPAPLPLG